MLEKLMAIVATIGFTSPLIAKGIAKTL